MGKRNDTRTLCLDSLMRSRDPKVKAVYGQMVAEEGFSGLDRALLKTAVFFKSRLPKRMHASLEQECRKAGIAV